MTTLSYMLIVGVIGTTMKGLYILIGSMMGTTCVKHLLVLAP